MSKLPKVLADLKIKAMLFDMNIDWEILELEPKVPNTTPVWLTRHQTKRKESDIDEYFDMDRE